MNFFCRIQPLQAHEREAAHQRTQGPYEEHQWLWERFFPAPRGTARDFLFRRIGDGSVPTFYALSARPARSDVPGWEVKLQDYAPRISAGDRLHFDLRANPVISRLGEPQRHPDGTPRLCATGKRAGSPKCKVTRHDVVMHAKKTLLAQAGAPTWAAWASEAKPALHDLVHEAGSRWLRERSNTHGFTLDEPCLTAEAYTQHRGKRGAILFSSIDFSGELTVTDPEAFTAALVHGIGHAKAFGCGLLLVRRAG